MAPAANVGRRSPIRQRDCGGDEFDVGGVVSLRGANAGCQQSLAFLGTFVAGNVLPVRPAAPVASSTRGEMGAAKGVIQRHGLGPW